MIASIPKIVLALIVAIAGAPLSAAAADGEAWVNGRWFDGHTFVSKTFYVVDGVLSTEAPQGRVNVHDLRGRYVVPAYGDAHHHGIDSETGLGPKIAEFLRNGIFYVKNPNVVPDFITPEVRRRINRPDSIDVTFANGGLTTSGSHPAPLHARLVGLGVFPGLKAEDMDGRAYFTVDSIEALDTKWPAIVAGKPEFIKTFLNGSDRNHHQGLSPEVLSEVVRRAHASGLRVSTHVDTARDFEIAVNAGSDEINHMPVPDPLEDSNLDAYLIAPGVAARAARQGTVVVATASVIPRFRSKQWDAAVSDSVVENQKRNLRVLLDAGVSVAIGSDGISGEQPFVTARDEIEYLRRNELVDNLALLRMWSQNTPATIFPKRKVGFLRSGYEANFLVLEGNPVTDSANLERISMRVKAGQILQGL